MRCETPAKSYTICTKNSKTFHHEHKLLNLYQPDLQQHAPVTPPVRVGRIAGPVFCSMQSRGPR